MKLKWVILIAVVLTIRAVSPFVILNQINSFLAKFSDVYYAQIEDFDISIFRGAYQFEGLSVQLKKTTEGDFANIRVIDVSIAWRELFQGRLNTDISFDGATVTLTNLTINTISKKDDDSDSKKAVKKLFPVRIGRIDLKNSSFEFADLIDSPNAERLKMTKLQGRLSNVTATSSSPLSLLSARGTLFDSTPIDVVAQLNLLKKPIAWDADIELKDFNLSNANGWLKRKLPLTFTSGRLNLYSEIKSESGKIEGYAKPFLFNVDVVANSEVFSGLKHFAIEISASAANLFLRTAKEKTLATKVLFSYENGDLKINSSKAFSEAFKNGFTEKIPEGIDNEISLSKKSMTISKRENRK